MTSPVVFDSRPLTAPVDRRAAREFTRRLRAEGRLPSAFSAAPAAGTVVAAVATVFAVIFLGIFGSIAVAVAVLNVVFSDRIAPWTIPIVGLVVLGGAVALIMVAVAQASGRASDRRFRLDAFARSNRMTYVPSIPAPHLPGMVFGLGDSRQSTDLVRGDLPRFVEFANYRYATGSGKNRSTHRWGYVAVKLDVPLPHIVLDALGNNALFGSNLPAAFHHDQRLSLEGDFDRYFSLYCPSGYERDALYLFTPDIMARFVDNAAALDVEIVDDWLFLYAKRDLSTLDPATWAWLFSVVAALLDKLAQWARWRDDRLATPSTDAIASGIPAATASPTPPPTPPPGSRPAGVAQPGRRLRRRFSWGAVVTVAVIVVWIVLTQLGGFATLAGLLSR